MDAPQLWRTAARELVHTFSDLGEVDYLHFSEDGSYILTNKGAVPLPSVPASSSGTSKQRKGAYLLRVAGRWLTCNSKKLLYLPYENRSEVVATRGETIALGIASGDIIFLIFNFQNGSPWD
jgi:hypothetical protein